MSGGDGHHLILGGTGFIGRNVALALARTGEPVGRASRTAPAEPIPRELSNLVSWRPVDVRTEHWSGVLDGVSVVHDFAWTSIPATAGRDPRADASENVLPTI